MDPAKELVEILVNKERMEQNSKYGEFIVQTNEIQFYLVLLVLYRAPWVGKNFKKLLERSTFDNLINYFTLTAQTRVERSLTITLKNYKDSRNALAHKIFTNEKLTVKECENSIELGHELLRTMKNIMVKE